MLYHNVMWKFCDAEGKTLDENIEIVLSLIHISEPTRPY